MSFFNTSINHSSPLNLSGKILITGGTGSLGTAILRRAHKDQWDAKFTVVARNETKMNSVKAEFPNVRCEVGDIRDIGWMNTIFPGHDSIIHAAAIKIVPLAEARPREAILTNVLGSMNVAQAAIESGVKRVVGISSDKAAGLTYYGNTKRLMEATFRQAREWGNTEFVLCRYGNVLKSANSVVPFFQKQIDDDKPFTITHLGMTRFWLSMQQAIDLILYTFHNAESGDIVVPKAPAMKVVDLAKTLDPDREIIEIGIRAGERLHETLIIREEAMHSQDVGDHFIIRPPETTVLNPLPFQYEYTSDKPVHWLTSDELKELLENS